MFALNTTKPQLKTAPKFRPPCYEDQTFIDWFSSFSIYFSSIMWPPHYYGQFSSDTVLVFLSRFSCVFNLTVRPLPNYWWLKTSFCLDPVAVWLSRFHCNQIIHLSETSFYLHGNFHEHCNDSPPPDRFRSTSKMTFAFPDRPASDRIGKELCKGSYGSAGSRNWKNTVFFFFFI